MVDLVSKFLKVGEQVLDTCADTLATIKPCLKLPEHRKFVPCEKNSMRFEDALSSLVKVYANQVLSSECVKAGATEQLNQEKSLERKFLPSHQR